MPASTAVDVQVRHRWIPTNPLVVYVLTAAAM